MSDSFEQILTSVIKKIKFFKNGKAVFFFSWTKLAHKLQDR